MVARFDIPPPGAGGTYNTGEHNRGQNAADPSSALTMRELADLRWFFNQAESDMGIKSTFGQQLDAALSQRISDDAMREAKLRRTVKTKLRRGWRPNAKAEALMRELGLDGLLRATRVDLSDEYIYMHAPMHSAPADPYEDDHVLVLVRRANEIRARLRHVGERHAQVLAAVYGPVVNGESREQFRKKFGELVEVVIAIVASRRAANDPPARALVRAKLTDESFVLMMRRASGEYLRAACRAYAEARR